MFGMQVVDLFDLCRDALRPVDVGFGAPPESGQLSEQVLPGLRTFWTGRELPWAVPVVWPALVLPTPPRGFFSWKVAITFPVSGATTSTKSVSCPRASLRGLPTSVPLKRVLMIFFSQGLKTIWTDREQDQSAVALAAGSTIVAQCPG
ncbi:hypothetical protein ACFS4T_00270 [Pseudomonas lini]